MKALNGQWLLVDILPRTNLLGAQDFKRLDIFLGIMSHSSAMLQEIL